ncbi:hypothetical protein DH2020_041706 [Rehmannia glutinosa]|uniref:Peptidase A1 domain-containing protein n=1 Tax=Rehmannia glutinosa TaxID=99300 RepID=A0ABR0UQ44_REHGL
MVTCRRQIGFFLIIAVFIIINSAKLLEGHGGIKFELTHRRNGATQLERLRQLLHSDTIRLRGISEKNRIACAKLMLIADTGSDLTWMNCRYRCRGASCRRNSRKRRIFRADHSSSFRAVPCSSSTCKIDLANLFSLARCASPMDPCAYDYSKPAFLLVKPLQLLPTSYIAVMTVIAKYSDGSAALGVFGNETVTFSLTNGRKTRLHHVLVGCSESSRGRSFQVADGVMGLGYSNYSFAVKAANKFGGKFSYCLVDHLSPKNISSYLIFGSHKEVNISFNRMKYTELILGVINPFYAVNIKGISIGGSMLDIPAETWNLSGVGGVIVDSGSSLTGLTQPAYQPVMAALRLSLVNFKNLNLDIGPVEYCFNSTGFSESLVPRLVFHFSDGARFEPPVKSYVIDAAPG